MAQFQLLAQPLRGNLFLLIPLALFFGWRSRDIKISWRQFLFATLFTVSFGFVEATVVVYFRAAAGLSPDYKGALSQVQQLLRPTDWGSVPRAPGFEQLIPNQLLGHGWRQFS